MATTKTMPPLPSGSFDLNAPLAADDIEAEIARQIEAATPPKPEYPAPETPPAAKAGK